MKKILIILCIIPLFVLGQTNHGYTPVQIGQTIYDMQTNESLARRLVIYPDGQKSTVWTQGNNTSTAGYPDRGTGYNHFKKNSWNTIPSGRIETSRSGWPNIGHIKKNGKDVEYVISHYSPSDPSQPTGGIYLLINDSIGSSNWSQQFMDLGTGPIWYRTSESGDYIYVIGTYNDTSLHINTIQSPTVFSKYQISTNKWVVKNQLLSDYDTSLYKAGYGDVYSIDAKDNFVAIVIGPKYGKVTLWKSSDSAKTFKRTIIDSLIIPKPKLKGDTVRFNYSDGSVNVIIDKYGYSKVFWSTYTGYKIYGNDTQWYDKLKHGIMYYNEKTAKKMKIPTAQVVDRNCNGIVDVGNGWNYTRTANGIQYNIQAYETTNTLLTFPNATIDTSGNIYLIFSAIVEFAYFSEENDPNTGAPINENLHDIYVIYSKDDGNTWGNAQNLTNNTKMEDVFGSVAKYCGDGKLHMIWQEDKDPGTSVGDYDPIDSNSILYMEVPLSDILQNKIGKGDSILLPTPSKPSGSTVLCENSSSNNYTTSGVAGATLYEWSLSPASAGSIFGSSTSATVNWNDGFIGTTSIKVRAFNNCNYSYFSDSLVVTIYPLLSAPSDPLGDTVLCQNSPDNNYNTSGVAGASSYFWTLSPSSAGVINSTSINGIVQWNATFTGIAKIKVCGVNICGNGSFSNDIIVTIIPDPATPSITLNGHDLTSSSPNGNQWYDSTGIISGDTNKTFTPLIKGRYYVIVTINGCSSKASNKILFDPTNIEEYNTNNTIKIYPNPVSGKVNIESSDYKNTTIEISTIEGKLLQSLVLQSPITQLDLNNYTSGVYMLKIINKESVLVSKLIKQ